MSEQLPSVPVQLPESFQRLQASEIAAYIRQWWQGDVHVHSEQSTRSGWNRAEGIYTVTEATEYARKLGLTFTCFAEHSSDPGNPRTLTADSPEAQSLLEQANRIYQLNKGQKKIAVLSGVEANIMLNRQGKPILDLPDAVLQQLDLVIGSRHALPVTQEKDPISIQQTLLYVIHSGVVDIIGHPDRYTRRDGKQPDDYWESYWGLWPEVLVAMQQEHVAFELNLNSQPSRKLVEMAAQAGVVFSINYDVHDFNQYKAERNSRDQRGELAKQRWSQERMSEEDRGAILAYKEYRLAEGPGIRATLRLVRWLRQLESYGVTSDRVMNSSRRNVLQFLTDRRGKSTANLRLLQKVYSS